MSTQPDQPGVVAHGYGTTSDCICGRNFAKVRGLREHLTKSRVTNGTYLTHHGIPAWDCPDCGKQMHARTKLEWGWTRCRRCQSAATLAALGGAR